MARTADSPAAPRVSPPDLPDEITLETYTWTRGGWTTRQHSWRCTDGARGSGYDDLAEAAAGAQRHVNGAHFAPDH